MEEANLLNLSQGTSLRGRSSFDLRIDGDVNCVFIKHYGLLTVDVLKNRYDGIFENCDFHSHLNFLIDKSECRYEVTPNGIRELVNYFQDQMDTFGKSRHAILCGTSIDFGYSRMQDSLYDAGLEDKAVGIKTTIYNVQNVKNVRSTYNDALHWLGIPQNYPLPFTTTS